MEQSSSMITVQKKSDSPIKPIIKRPSPRAWGIWLMAAIFYLYEYILRASPSVMTEQLMQDFAITTTSLGLLSSMYYYAYTPLQIPIGVVVDWLGARVVVTVSCILCVLGTIFFSLSDSLFLAQMGRFLIGAGSACAFLCTLKLVADWFPPKYFAVLSGMTTLTGITTGGYVVGRPFAEFVNNLGWRDAMMCFATLGVGVALLCWLVIRNHPHNHNKKLALAPETTKENLWHSIGILVKSRQTWLIALYGCMFYVPISVFSELWAVPYLMKRYGIDNATAASIGVMVVLGKGIGAPGIALLSNALESRKKVMYACAFLGMLAFGTAIYLPVPIWLMQSLLFFLGGCVGAQVLCFALNQEINPKEISATTVGFTNMIVMMSGIIFQPLMGVLLDRFWDGTISNLTGRRIYSIDAYQTAISVLPVCIFVAWILVFFIKETFPRDEEKLIQEALESEEKEEAHA